MFDQKIIEDPRIKSFVFSIDEDEFRRKQKGLKVQKKNLQKLKKILPENDSMTFEGSPDHIPAGQNSDLNTRRSLHYDDENVMMSDQQFRPKLICTNKYIGVYKGKFGILSKKMEVPTKAELERQSMEYQSKVYALHRQSLERSPMNKLSRHTKSARQLIKNPYKPIQNPHNQHQKHGNSFETLNYSDEIQNIRLKDFRNSINTRRRGTEDLAAPNTSQGRVSIYPP